MTTRSRLTGLAVAAIAVAFAGACASGGSSVLSKTTLTADDLATANYGSVYDFLRAHNRARIVSFQGDEYLTVYSRGGNVRSGQVSGGDFDPSGGVGSAGSAAPQMSGTAPAEGGGEALLIVNDNEVQGNTTQILQQMDLSQVAELRILRPSETSARYGGDGRVGSVVIVTKDS